MNQATATQQHKDEEEVIGQEFQKLPGYVSPWSCSSRTTLAGDAAGVWNVIWPVLITPDGKSYVYSDYRILSELYLANGLMCAPHLSARGTSTLLNNALLSAHFLFAD